MPKTKFKIIIYFFIIFSLVLPSFVLAQEETPQAPQTVEEAQFIGLKILSGIPGAVKDVWQNQALPIWQGMWNWSKPYLNPWWQKFLDFWGMKKPELNTEFQKEKKEMKEDLPNVPKQGQSLWEKFKDLWK